MSPTGRGRKQKRAKSVEGLLETAADLGRVQQVQADVQMKKAKSLEEYLDTCDNDDDDDDGEDGGSVSLSVSDSLKKKNFVDKCINKMKLFMTARKKSPPPNPK